MFEAAPRACARPGLGTPLVGATGVSAVAPGSGAGRPAQSRLAGSCHCWQRGRPSMAKEVEVDSLPGLPKVCPKVNGTEPGSP